jgi:phospholipid-translocating ATPase
MVFKKLQMEYGQFDSDSIGDIKSMVKQVCETYSGPMPDLINAKQDLLEVTDGSFSRKRKNKMREQNIVVCDTIRALALCHNVTPTFSETGDVEYQASSPDEVALVKFAATMGMNLKERD